MLKNLSARISRLPGALRDALTLTSRRFTIPLLWAVVGTVAALILVEVDSSSALRRLVMASVLGLPLSIALTLAGERSGRTARFVLAAAGVVVPLVYLLTLPRTIGDASPEFHFIRFVMLVVAAHLAVSFAPYLRRGERNGFWHFNKSLFLRIATSMLLTFVFAIGLTAAVGAIDVLFDVSMPNKLYPRIWIVSLGILNTFYFLAGVPESINELQSETSYPRGLYVLSHFVMLPLTVLYFLILYAYIGRIVIEWSWPQGTVSALILGFSGFGILTLLLAYPRYDDEAGARVRMSVRVFYALLVPLAVVLFLAVWQRVAPYGITESRYLGIVVAFWLGVMGVVLAFTRGRPIRLVPMTLAVLLVIVSFGPWGMFSVSQSSQHARLESRLNAIDLQADLPVMVPADQYDEIQSITRYMIHRHGEESVDERIRVPDDVEPYERTAASLAPIIERDVDAPLRGFFQWQSTVHDAIDISDYDRIAVLNPLTIDSGPLVLDPDGPSVRVDSNLIVVDYGSVREEIEVVEIARGYDQDSGAPIIVDRIVGDWDLRFVITNLGSAPREGGYVITLLEGVVLGRVR